MACWSRPGSSGAAKWTRRRVSNRLSKRKIRDKWVSPSANSKWQPESDKYFEKEFLPYSEATFLYLYDVSPEKIVVGYRRLSLAARSYSDEMTRSRLKTRMWLAVSHPAAGMLFSTSSSWNSKTRFRSFHESGYWYFSVESELCGARMWADPCRQVSPAFAELVLASFTSFCENVPV